LNGIVIHILFVQMHTHVVSDRKDIAIIVIYGMVGGFGKCFGGEMVGIQVLAYVGEGKGNEGIFIGCGCVDEKGFKGMGWLPAFG